MDIVADCCTELSRPHTAPATRSRLGKDNAAGKAAAAGSADGNTGGDNSEAVGLDGFEEGAGAKGNEYLSVACYDAGTLLVRILCIVRRLRRWLS